MRRLGTSFIAIFLISHASFAFADQPKASATLVYSSADACPDEASFRDQVNARLGYDPFVETATRHVDVTITRDHGKLIGRAALSTNGAAPTARELGAKGDQCGPLVTALATSIAIALDSAGAPPDYWTPPESNDEPAPAIDHPIANRPENSAFPAAGEFPPPASPREKPLVIFGAASVVGSLGVAPGPSLGPDLAVSFGNAKLSLEISGRAEATVGDGVTSSSDRIQATVFSGALAPCLNFDRIAACAMVRAGVFQGRASTVQNPQLASSPFAAVAARISYALPLGKLLGLRGGFELGVPVVRTSLEVDQKSIWTSPVVFAALSLSLTVKFE